MSRFRKLSIASVVLLSFAPLLPHAASAASPQAAAAPETEAQPKKTPPKPVYSVAPEYTEAARKKRVKGVCEFSLTLGIDGKPHDIVLTKSVAEGQPENLRTAAMSLDDKGMEAVLRYRFQPATVNGVPVEVTLHISVNFQLI